MDLNADFWDQRYQDETTGWDLGEVSPPIKAYIDQIDDKAISILIPGGGNAYEAEYLFRKGFHNVFVIDLSETALRNIKSRIPDFPAEQLLNGNFFELDRTFDLILEQTFFCAIHPDLRNDYVTKMNRLLAVKGKLAGVLFNVPLYTDRPPFGGSKSEYIKRFKRFFNILLMEKAHNSHESRIGRELFFILEKKSN
ncbi:Thiopurine S-methyltransferase (TPMT) [Formosa sp. Hel1_31_208]|uniref:methyltransferase domain-containing protein n=1 Tax=Formosa sp. Hel1_31_208 TaxID=1798225 RepID=UPI00087A06BC|nr:methyltransferase domain-containing protein [Formosa sp. Hel1_31_208]SDS24647.1 Thiopurine S-methyltransferase (TPMT) [Formosa sp. Hel1_31_208]